MKKEFTKEMVAEIEKANNEVKGTSVYGAYYVPFEAKTKGRWHHIGWGPANRTGVIKKTNNGNLYVYYTDSYGNEYRFGLTNIYCKKFNITSEVA